MTDTIEIPADAEGRIDVFAVDLPAEVMERFTSRSGDTDDPNAAWPLRAALGADYLDPAGIELVGIRDLAGLGLAGYLSEGLGATDEGVDANRDALEELDGHVLILRGRAYGGMAQTLRPREPLTHIATLHEEAAAPPGPALHAETAEPQAEVPPPPEDDPAPRRKTGSPLPIIAGGLILAAVLVAVVALGIGR
jgi:hypothetical protein